jgi:hypothetical protein
MTPFQAIRVSFSMWLARAREPIQERELAPVATSARHQPSGSTRPGNGHLKMAQTGRRKTDSPFRHESFIQRIWKAIVAWTTAPHTGAKW